MFTVLGLLFVSVRFSRSVGIDGDSTLFMFLTLLAAVWIPGGSSPVTSVIQHRMGLYNICSATATLLTIDFKVGFQMQ